MSLKTDLDIRVTGIVTGGLYDDKKKTTEKKTFLLDELLLEVFSYLNPQQLVALSRTSKQWYHLSSKDLLWEPFARKLEIPLLNKHSAKTAVLPLVLQLLKEVREQPSNMTQKIDSSLLEKASKAHLLLSRLKLSSHVAVRSMATLYKERFNNDSLFTRLFYENVTLGQLSAACSLIKEFIVDASIHDHIAWLLKAHIEKKQWAEACEIASSLPKNSPFLTQETALTKIFMYAIQQKNDELALKLLPSVDSPKHASLILESFLLSRWSSSLNKAVFENLSKYFTEINKWGVPPMIVHFCCELGKLEIAKTIALATKHAPDQQKSLRFLRDAYLKIDDGQGAQEIEKLIN